MGNKSLTHSYLCWECKAYVKTCRKSNWLEPRRSHRWWIDCFRRNRLMNDGVRPAEDEFGNKQRRNGEKPSCWASNPFLAGRQQMSRHGGNMGDLTITICWPMNGSELKQTSCLVDEEASVDSADGKPTQMNDGTPRIEWGNSICGKRINNTYWLDQPPNALMMPGDPDVENSRMRCAQYSRRTSVGKSPRLYVSMN